MNDLDQKLREMATVPILLVASDYDGTIAPIVSNPADARPHREAIVALRGLSSLPQTTVSVISGRALSELAELTGLNNQVRLVGSHGSEFDPDFARNLSPEVIALRDRLEDELREIAETDPGFSIETKPASIAIHYRNVEQKKADQALRAVLDGPAAYEGVHLKQGKMVVELGVVSTNKGDALETMRHRCGASAVIFMGDDATDEDAFATLTGPDIGVKIGEGASQASYRIEGPREVAQLLAKLSEFRADWLAGSVAVPIEQHAMLADQRTVAIETPDARIVWYCVPRIDSPALFAELLGGPAAGHFTIAAADDAQPSHQFYQDNSLVLTTRWENFTVTDYLDCSAGRPTQRAGRSDLIRMVEGSGRVRIEFAPRLDFGRTPTRLSLRGGGIEIADTFDPIILRSPDIEWELIEEGKHQTARAEVDLTSEPLMLDLCYGTGSLQESAESADDRYQLTERFWSSWTQRLTLPFVESDLVRHSALVLKGLCYGPSGAISAAATSSLPEHIGGVRNWDYRYCWLRDGAMSASALVKLGSISEAMQFLDWVLQVVENCESPERLQPLYAVTGQPLGPEAEIGELSGYRGSRPVRVGNGAARQVQLDVFGPIVDLVALLVDRHAPLSSEHWRLVENMVWAVQRRWRDADHGIWEIRRSPRHHVHSRVMCWLTIDRAITISKRFLNRERDEWVKLRDEIADDIFENGYKPEVNGFTAAYDGIDPDAATLHVGLSGLLPPDDPRFEGTVRLIEQHLLEGPTVYRYRSDDGLPGFEGGFHICATWLVEAYIRSGRTDDAWRLFNKVVALVGETGMLSEQYGAKTKRALGNVPQAYSHLGLIENAVSLANVT